MADQAHGQPKDPSTTEGKTGVEGGYGGDTGFASDQAQGTSGQVSGQGGTDAALGEGDSAVSGSETEAGDGQGGSASGREPPTKDWAEHAAAEGAAVSADPGESGDVSSPTSVGHGRLSVEENTPKNAAAASGQPAKDTDASGLTP